MKFLSKSITYVDGLFRGLANVVKREEVAFLLCALVIAYVSFLERDSINPLSWLLSNPVFRAIALLAIVYVSAVNTGLGLLLAIAFVVTMSHNSGKFIMGFEDLMGAEGFADAAKPDEAKPDMPPPGEEPGAEEKEKKEGFEAELMEDELAAVAEKLKGAAEEESGRPAEASIEGFCNAEYFAAV